MADAMEDLGLQAEMSRLQSALRGAARPRLGWARRAASG